MAAATRQLPLGWADFAFAYIVACEEQNKVLGRWGSLDLKDKRECVEDGLDEIREMRRIDRMPAGAKAMREKLLDALDLRAARAEKRIRFARAMAAPLLAQRWRLAMTSRVNAAYQRAQCATTSYAALGEKFAYGRGKAYQRIVSVEVSSNKPTLTRTYDNGLTLHVHESYIRTVIVPQIIVVDGFVVVHADPVRDFHLPPGVAAIYDVLYHAPDECTTPGVVFVPSDKTRKPHFAHSRESRIFGAIAAACKLSVYRKQRRAA
jgi:hypothetical protein